MNQTLDRIPCPKCRAANFPSSAVCWQCGEPLHPKQAQPPSPPPPVQPSAPTPPPQPPVQPAPSGFQPPPEYPPARANGGGQTLVVLGFVFAALGFCCCPLVFGILAIIMGVIAMNRGHPLGIWVVITGIASLVIGSVFVALVWRKNLTHYQHSWPIPGTRWPMGNG